jgi:hypothetical protein
LGIGNSHAWTFTIPSAYNPADFQSAFFRVSMVADDHSTSLSAYTIEVSTNDTIVYLGPANLPHVYLMALLTAPYLLIGSKITMLLLAHCPERLISH